MKLKNKMLVGGFTSMAASCFWLAFTFNGHTTPRWAAMLAGIIGGVGTALVIAGFVNRDQ